MLCSRCREEIRGVGWLKKGHTSVGVLLRSNVVQLNDVAALGAALNGALTGDLEAGSVSNAVDGLWLMGSRIRHTVSQLTWWESTG